MTIYTKHYSYFVEEIPSDLSKSLRAYKIILEEPGVKLMSFDFKTRHLPVEYLVPLLMKL